MRKNDKHPEDQLSPLMSNLIHSLLLDQQNEACAMCQESLDGVESKLDHKRYEKNVTLYDLQLLCPPCFAKEMKRKVEAKILLPPRKKAIRSTMSVNKSNPVGAPGVSLY